MATRRRKRRVNRRPAAAASNPRRRRRSYRRSRNPVVARSVTRRRITSNPRRRRRARRRSSNPSMAGVGSLLKQMIYGAGGAIVTRIGYGVASGFIPAGLGSSRVAKPAIKAAIAAVPVRWAGGKFLGKQQGDLMMLGGLIDAGVDLVNAFLGDVEGQLTTIIRAPVQQLSNGEGVTTVAGFADVEDVPIGSAAFAGFGDVEDVPQGIFL